MKKRFAKYLKGCDNYLHIGCNIITPDSWINIDGSWNAWVSRYPLIKKLLSKLHIISNEAAQYSWPRNILIWDINKGLPFPNNSISGIYASYVLEHLTHPSAKFFVQECYRVLINDGVIRLVVPDLRSYIDKYVKQKREMPDSSLPANYFMERLNICHWDSWESSSFPIRIYRSMKDFLSHKWMSDRESLAGLLLEVGFEEVSERKFLNSSINLIKDVEREQKDISIYLDFNHLSNSSKLI